MIRDPLQTLVHLIATEANPHQLLLQVVAEATVLEEVKRLARTLLHTEAVVEARVKECCRVSKIPLEFFWERLQLLARILNLIPCDQNYYEILELDRRASPQQIKQAYRRLSFAFHPDTNPNDPHAAEHFRNLKHAYEVLSHDLLRTRYDHNLKEHLWDEGENRKVSLAGLLWRGKWYRTWPVVLPIVVLVGTVLLFDYSQWQTGHYLTGMGRRSERAEPGSQIHRASIPAKPVGDTQANITSPETPVAESEPPAAYGRTPEEASTKPLGSMPGRAGSQEERGEDAGRAVASDKTLPKLPPGAASVKAEPPEKGQQSRKHADARQESLGPESPLGLGDSAPATAAPHPTGFSVMQEEHLEREIRTFIYRYTATYERRDTDTFMRLFETNAIENGRPIQELVPLYRANFSRAEKLRYRIDLGRWEVREGEVMVDGTFNLAVQFEQEAPVESTGTIQLTLVRRDGDFGVKRLNYNFKKPRKNTD